ncbi:F-box domain, cyclin-like protein [Tanacetum coccineum]|uniref:F-box domain, cyclin-like protein n=1 Tax=Tanacetum coccineum TaxID=301880 RepID=A0ABQ5AWZ0_9ASTR
MIDMVHDATNVMAKGEDEDRISNLPDDIIHRILSFLDIKYAIQTSQLSRKWKHVWTKMPYLSFNSRMFRNVHLFAKFTDHVLSHRSDETDVSEIELTFTGLTTTTYVKNLVNYAYLHNVRKLTMIYVISFPKVFIVVAPKLKNLTASVRSLRDYPQTSFDCLLLTEGFYSLEKVNLFLSPLGSNRIDRIGLPVLLNLFQKLRSANFLILNSEIIEYEALKSLFLTRIDASEWEKIETELGSIRHFERTRSTNIHTQSNAPADVSFLP